MSVLIVGAGSAAVHHAYACQEMGLEYTIVTRTESKIHEFSARFFGRYGESTNATFQSIQKKCLDQNFHIGIVATPPMTHSDALKFLANLHLKVIYIEKPFTVHPSLVVRVVESGTRLLSGSQFVLRSSFSEFRDLSRDVIGQENSFIRCVYSESLAAPAAAHSWDPDFLDGWVTDEMAGGGVLSEYSHALHWVGWILEQNDKPLPELELVNHSKKLNRNSRISIDNVEMSFPAVESIAGNIRQTCGINSTEKLISVTGLDTGKRLILDVGFDKDSIRLISSRGNIEERMLFTSTRKRDSTELIAHLKETALDPSLDSPLSLRVALWVDSMILQVRRGVFK